MIKSQAKVSAMRWIISLFGAAGLTAALAFVMIQLIAVSDERGGRELVGYVPSRIENDCVPDFEVYLLRYQHPLTLPEVRVILSQEIAAHFSDISEEEIDDCGWRSGLVHYSNSSTHSCPITIEIQSETVPVHSEADVCLNSTTQRALGRYLTCLSSEDTGTLISPLNISGDVTILHIARPPLEARPSLTKQVEVASPC